LKRESNPPGRGIFRISLLLNMTVRPAETAHRPTTGAAGEAGSGDRKGDAFREKPAVWAAGKLQ
jgi:hypothetical protein